MILMRCNRLLKKNRTLRLERCSSEIKPGKRRYDDYKRRYVLSVHGMLHWVVGVLMQPAFGSIVLRHWVKVKINSGSWKSCMRDLRCSIRFAPLRDFVQWYPMSLQLDSCCIFATSNRPPQLAPPAETFSAYLSASAAKSEKCWLPLRVCRPPVPHRPLLRLHLLAAP
jgi:hypothetical protein